MKNLEEYLEEIMVKYAKEETNKERLESLPAEEFVFEDGYWDYEDYESDDLL